jgi:hypothetical protein
LGALAQSRVIIGRDSSSDDDVPYSTIRDFPLHEGRKLDINDRLVALVGDASFICKGRLDDLAPGVAGELNSAISLSSLGVDGESADAHGVVFFVLAFSTRTGHSPNVVR